MNIAIVYNQVAGNLWRRGGSLVQALTRQLIQLGNKVDIYSHAREISTDSLANYAVITAAGGDGTINCVAHMLAKAKSSLPLAVVPIGTSNVWAREWGIRPEVDFLITYITHAHAVPFSLATINDTIPFLFICSAGYDASILAKTNPRLKSYFGKGAIALTALKQWVRGYRAPPFCVSLNGGGERIHTFWAIFTRMNHYAGTFSLDITQRIDSPYMTAILFQQAGRRDFLRYLWAFSRSKLATCAGVRIIPEVQSAQFHPPFPRVEYDGDLLAPPSFLNIQFSHERIWVKVI